MPISNHKPKNPPEEDIRPVEYYEIYVKGQLVPQWTNWFEGLSITVLENDEVIISGPVTDQASLHGLLSRIRDLNLELIHVKNVNHTWTEKTK